MNTVLITGSSSGFGLETARLFLDQGWRVVATMRTPREDALPTTERLRVLGLDVTDPQSIKEAVDGAGPIDALVNNAGIGLMLFDTNTLGTMAVTHAVLPQFRQRKRGVIVNSRAGGLGRSDGSLTPGAHPGGRRRAGLGCRTKQHAAMNLPSAATRVRMLQ